MNIETISIAIYLIASVFFILGIKKMSKVKTARQGNAYAAFGMFIAIAMSLFDKKIISYELIIAGILIGTAIAIYLVATVTMTAMPQMVALLNGFGGAASLFVSLSEFNLMHRMDAFTATTDFLGVFVGSLTFTGSLVAFGKLQGLVTEKSVVYPLQHTLNLILSIITLLFGFLVVDTASTHFFTSFTSSLFPDPFVVVGILAILSLILGVTLVLRIGGADMPVLISLHNSFAGIAAAMTGFIFQNSILIITGGIVGSAGIILTRIMCKSMNRSLIYVLLGGFGTTPVSAVKSDKKDMVIKEVGVEEAAMLFEAVSSVIIVPGYGMAVAQAQHVVRELSELLQKRGVSVKFAIHPIAGRMPGHMNVLLAEANVPYEQLIEMENINDEFANTDMALIIGANDVTNPAARHDTASPIYGMPILNVDKAKTVIIVKRSMKPGYAGIENELYGYPNALMYFGDAKEAISKLMTEIKESG